MRRRQAIPAGRMLPAFAGLRRSYLFKNREARQWGESSSPASPAHGCLLSAARWDTLDPASHHLDPQLVWPQFHCLVAQMDQV